ncbi:MAG: hypothetical protein WBE76_30675, partial [Terracidiphilus sp.]
MSEPQVIRYASEPAEAALKWNRLHWPSAVPSAVLKTPAASICHAAATKLFTGRRARRERMLPAAHEIPAPMSEASASRRVRSPAIPMRSDGETSAASPAKPSAMPS